MAGTKTSARNNRTASRPDRPERPGELRIITPCNGGRHAYIHDPKTRRTAHVATGSAAFTAEMSRLAEAGYGAHLRAEFAALDAAHPGHGWARAADRVPAPAAQ